MEISREHVRAIAKSHLRGEPPEEWDRLVSAMPDKTQEEALRMYVEEMSSVSAEVQAENQAIADTATREARRFDRGLWVFGVIFAVALFWFLGLL